jgi:hypothetical protein
VVSKRARVVEEVVVQKEVTEHTETVRGTVRHTEVDVQREPEPTAASRRGTAPQDFATYDPAFRQHYARSTRPMMCRKDALVESPGQRRAADHAPLALSAARHSEGEPGVDLRPDPVHHLLAMADDSERRHRMRLVGSPSAA